MDYTYFEDCPVGGVCESGSYVVTAAEIIAFASLYDPQPMHLDATAPGGLIASGWQTASLTVRLFITAGWYRPPPGTLGMGVEDLRWPRSVYPGDTLSLRVETIAARLSGSKPGFGILTHQLTTSNQRGETVLTMTSTAFTPVRQGAELSR